jgi:EmrB/QacA subfamily drug resistance transporter
MSNSSQHSVAIALLVAGAFFMENLDGTVIATALPQMAQTFNTGPIALNIGMTSYMLSLAVFIPISGWIADRFGARTVFGGAIGLFTLASLLCGISNSLWEFTAARTLQGIAGAMMVPVGQLVVLRCTEKKDLMRLISYITWPGLVAPLVGPPIGGLITTYASWRWIFFLNIPLGVVGIAFTGFLLNNQRGARARPFDWIGFILTGSTCAMLMYSLELIGQPSTVWSMKLFFLAFSLAIGGLAVMHARRHKTPLIDLSSLHIRTFAVAVWGGSLFRIAISAIPFLLPLLFQVAFGMSAFSSGLLILAVFAGNLAMKTITTPVIRRFGFRWVLIVNGLLTAVSLFACSFLSPETPMMVIIAVLFFGGLCRSMQFTSLNTLGFSDIPSSHMSATTTFYSMVTQLTMGMGIAAGAIGLRTASLLRGDSTGIPNLMDFHISFGLIAAIALVSVFDFLKLKPGAGSVVSWAQAADEEE